MGFLQVAEARKMSIEEIEQNISEEPNNNIVSIKGVQDGALNKIILSYLTPY